MQSRHQFGKWGLQHIASQKSNGITEKNIDADDMKRYRCCYSSVMNQEV